MHGTNNLKIVDEVLDETLLIRDLKPALSENVGSEKLVLTLSHTGCSSVLFNLVQLATDTSL